MTDPRPLSAEEEAKLRAAVAVEMDGLAEGFSADVETYILWSARLLATLDAERARHAALVSQAQCALSMVINAPVGDLSWWAAACDAEAALRAALGDEP